jgi:putative flippase GtrA
MFRKFNISKSNMYSKKKNLHKYVIIGLVNTSFSYFNGIFFLYFYYENFGPLFVTIATSVINIFFSFCNYKFFFFRTKKIYFFSEYLKMNFFQFFSILLNYFMLWLLIEKININIYLTQFILIIISVIASIIINFKFVFKNK